jgi:alkanesulfonate monooxygenase SsuD/methylene tetrahydromethanopterin reductase-like flavin-dependent oxidoreductase (luciferase family)
VGVLVTGVPYRHPAVLANMAATLDIISGGRLELGIGAGWNHEEANAYGIDLHPTLRERFDAFDEACEAIIGLLANETTTFHGKYVQLENARCNPKPFQRPHPPICIGGGGERRTLRSVARFAQHWNFAGGSVEQWVAKRDVLRRHCDAVGRDPAEIMTSTHLRGGAGALDVDELFAQAKRYADAGLDLGIVYLPVPHTPAVLDDVATALTPLAS